MNIKVIYQGDLHTEATHIKSGAVISTDAPVDNNGKGEAFSPTDLAATALTSCILTIMAMKARDMKIELKNTEAEVVKIMTSNLPRRIEEIKIVFNFPKLNLDEKQRIILERVAHSCPVSLSLSPEVKQTVIFNW